MRILTLGFVYGLSLLCCLDEVVSAEEVNQQTVEKWLDQLSTGTRSERANAQRELLEAGPRVLEWFPAIESVRDVAAREQLRRIRIELERRSAKESVQASLLTLSGEMPLRDALREIADQSGNALQFGDLSPQRLAEVVSTDFQSVPFWQVMTSLAERAEFHWKRAKFERELVLIDGAGESAVASQVLGSVLFQVISIKTRPIGTDGKRHLFRMRCRLAVEPRLRPLFLSVSARNLKLRDAAGTRLRPYNPDAQYELTLGESGEVAFDVDFVSEDTNVDWHECDFQGRLDLTVAAGTETIRFRNLARSTGASRRRGGVIVTLREISRSQTGNDRILKTRLAVAYETGGPAFESHRTWIYHNQAFLEGPNGERQQRDAGFSTELATDGGAILEYSFRNPPFPPDETDFLYVAPTLITELPIEFHFPRLLDPKRAVDTSN